MPQDRHRAPWSRRDVVFSLLEDAHRLDDKVWITSYFAARHGPRWLRPLAGAFSRGNATLRLEGLPAPLHLSRESGGLATYYEIVRQRIYEVPDDVPAMGDTVVDVGANIGVFSLWAAGRVGPAGRVVAIEPHPVSHSFLVANIAPFSSRVDAVRAACGRTCDELALRFPPGRLSVASTTARADRTQKVVVHVRPLDEVLDDLAVGDIGLLKVDIEGMEFDMLCGALRTLERTKRVVMELTHRDRDIERLLESAGFRGSVLKRGMWGRRAAKVVTFAR